MKFQAGEKINLEPITPEFIQEVVERIVDVLDPDKIILFGSFANGKPHEYSDLDLFIIKSGIDNRLELQGQVCSLFWDYSIPMDVLVRTPKQVAQAIESGNSFLKYEVLGKGKVLYEKDNHERYENPTSDNFEQPPPKYYEQLLFYAQADLETAERSVREETRFYHKPCFDARECVEKSLKAFIEAAGKPSPPVHGLITLLRECGIIDKSFLQFRKECDILNRYVSDARYPAGLEDYDFTADTAIEAVTIAREIFDFVKEKIQRRKEMGLL